MIEHSNLVATAWDEHLLVGIARSVTDFHYCCYLSDLAVDVAYQRQGVGRRLLQTTQDALGAQCSIILLSAPAAVDYYPHLGFERHDCAWVLARLKSVRTGAEQPSAPPNGGLAASVDNVNALGGPPSVS
jgi:GNAT superfamily N-acetyltransferase